MQSGNVGYLLDFTAFDCLSLLRKAEWSWLGLRFGLAFRGIPDFDLYEMAQCLPGQMIRRSVSPDSVQALPLNRRVRRARRERA